ncbi:hypothetical protein BDZ89DRAFT_1138304 [Hymenopellis radicata]|nr:hypothetical protein BDZ89DRAFT_1138304 [Hymenopellis radicata]
MSSAAFSFSAGTAAGIVGVEGHHCLIPTLSIFDLIFVVFSNVTLSISTSLSSSLPGHVNLWHGGSPQFTPNMTSKNRLPSPSRNLRVTLSAPPIRLPPMTPPQSQRGAILHLPIASTESILQRAHNVPLDFELAEVNTIRRLFGGVRLTVCFVDGVLLELGMIETGDLDPDKEASVLLRSHLASQMCGFIISPLDTTL